MAIYHLAITPLSRSAGRRATAAAAYRAGERIRDERSGKLFNHSRRRDVLHKEIVLPGVLANPAHGVQSSSPVLREQPVTHAAQQASRQLGPSVSPQPSRPAHESTDPLAWARDRSRLWNQAERVELRRNSRVAREFMVSLPHELDPVQRIALARRFSQELADRYKVAVDLAVHAPRPHGDQRNYHAHLLATTREVTPEGLGAKAGLDMNGSVRHRQGLSSGIAELRSVRARWAELANFALREANIEARIDHRSLAAQGIDRTPTRHIPYAVYRIQRRAAVSRTSAAEPAVTPSRPAAATERALRPPPSAQISGQAITPLPAAPEPAPLAPLNTEEVRHRALEAWLQMRYGGEGAQRAALASARREVRHQHVRDDDLAL